MPLCINLFSLFRVKFLTWAGRIKRKQLCKCLEHLHPVSQKGCSSIWIEFESVIWRVGCLHLANEIQKVYIQLGYLQLRPCLPACLPPTSHLIMQRKCILPLVWIQSLLFVTHMFSSMMQLVYITNLCLVALPACHVLLCCGNTESSFSECEEIN